MILSSGNNGGVKLLMDEDGESSCSEMIDDENSESSNNGVGKKTAEDWKRERSIQLGFQPQKEIIYNKLLPYATDIDAEATKWFQDIKANLGRAVALRELRPGIVVWISRLNKFIRLYGLRFPAKDQVELIGLLYSLLTIPDLEPFVINHVSGALCGLLKKRDLLSSDQLTLDWRPLHATYERVFHSHREAYGLIRLPAHIDINLRNVIKYCRPYFPLAATKEMVTEWRPLMCPLDVTMGKAISYFEMFLPTFGVAADNPDLTYKLWLEELLGFWSACANNPTWEPTLLALLARLAEDTTGIINWSSTLSVVFTRVLKMFGLPVHYNKTNVGHKGRLDSRTAARFIVATLGGVGQTQSYLTQLLQSLESYYHPANMGKFSFKLSEFMAKLADSFMKRVYRERQRKPSWGFKPAEEHLLGEDDITNFVLSLKPIVLHAMWTRWGFLDAGPTLQTLSSLRPALILPVLVSRLYTSLETVTEPHKLTASLFSVVGVARSLVTHHDEYPEGRTHVLPFLFSVLPGIDTNDLRKSMVTFQFISTIASLIPFVDNSTFYESHDNLTEEEKKIYQQSAQFEDFIVEFLNRCFAIVESSEVQQIRSEVSTDDASVSREDTMKDVGMASTFSAILMQCSLPLYQVALKKVRSWIQGRIMEWKISGKIAAGLCRCLTKVRPEEGLAGLMPFLLDLVERNLDEGEVGGDEQLGDELKFQLMVLSEMIRVPGKFIKPYIERLEGILGTLVKHSSREGDILTGAILRYTLRSLTQVCPVEYKSSPIGYDGDLTTYLPLSDWGKPGDVHKLQLDWYIPGVEELGLAQSLVDKFLGGVLSRLSDFSCKKIELSRNSLLSNLSLVSNIIVGAGTQLPPWTGSQVDLKKSVTDLGHMIHTTWSGDRKSLSFKGKNVRSSVVTVLKQLLPHLLLECPDHTKALAGVAGLYQSVLFYSGVPRDEYDQRWKGFLAVKKAMENKLLGSKKHIRAILVDRALLQHESRLIENSSRCLTTIHQEIFSDLLSLATNHYSEVRIKGQEVLGKGIKYFSYSYELIVPRLLELLKKDEEVSHEQFKGALYVILGTKGKSLMTKHHWPTFTQLVPAIVEASHSEKPSIIKVFQSLLDSVVHHIDTITIQSNIPDNVVQQSLRLWKAGEEMEGIKDSLSPSLELPSKAEISQGLVEMNKTGSDTLNLFLGVIDTLCGQVESGRLHWRHYNAGISILATLVRYDVKMPARAVKILVSNLVHDNIIVRKTSIHTMAAILKQNKRPHVKIEREMNLGEQKNVKPGDRPDNNWLQYKEENWPKSKEDWNKPNYVQKTHFGYYYWPQPMLVYAGEELQPSVDREEGNMNNEEREILAFFTNDSNLDKLMDFLSLEENKGKDKFDSRKFLVWKGLFRNFGPLILERMKSRIEQLVADQLESKQRAGAEVIAGLIRGSKHWGWDHTKEMWDWLVPVLRGLLGKVTVETIGDWGTCFATGSESRDPNRLYWLLEVLMEEPLRSQGSFLDSSRLYVLQGAVAQQEWRVGSLLHRLYSFLKPYLTHPYQNVRERLGSVVTNIYASDITFQLGPGGTQSPTVADLVSDVLPKLEMMTSEPDPELYNFHKKKEKLQQEITPEIFSAVCDKIPPELGVLVKQQGLDTLKSLVSSFPGGRVPPLGSSSAPPADMVRLPTKEMLAKMPIEMQTMIGLKMLSKPPNMGPRNSAPGARMPVPLMPGARMPGPPMQGLPMIPPPLITALQEELSKMDSKLSDDSQGTAWEERQSGVRLLQTMCKLIAGVLLRNWYPVKPELYRFIEMLALNESSELEPELARDCNIALACVATCLVPEKVLPIAVSSVDNVSRSSSWRAKSTILEFLQVFVFHNLPSFLALPSEAAKIAEVVSRLLKDDRIEVREKASKVLGGLLHCSFIPSEESAKLTEQFKSEVGKKLRKKPRAGEDQSTFQSKQQAAILSRHAGVLGLAAFVSSSPYEIPTGLPDLLMVLADHLHDPQPIPATVKKLFQEFKRTHQDNWEEHKENFTEDQLAVLTDLLVSPSYYA